MALGFGLALTSYRKAAGGGGSSTDPYFSSVPLLLNTTSTNAQQNNTFLDSSTNNFTITRNGTPTQGSFTPYLPNGYWSGYFNGSTDYLSVPDNAALDLGASDFTLEGWFNFSSLPSNMANLFCKWSASKSYTIYLFNSSGVYSLYFSYSTNGSAYTDVGPILFTPSVGAWNHIAVCRSSTNLVFYVNGSQRGATQAISGTLFDSTVPLLIGSLDATATCYFNGYASNIRVVKGTAVYTGSTYTVPTTPLTAITNTSLLTLQSNRFIDNSTNAFAITANGTPKVQAFQPFAPPASYSAATYGGSGYFGGSDYLSNSTNNTELAMGSGDFTIEFWLNAPSDALLHIIYDSRLNTTIAAGGFQIYHQSGTVYAYGGAVTNVLLCSGSITPNAWNHVAFVRNGSSTGNVKAYVNGVLTGTYGSADASNYSQGYLNIGCFLFGGSPANYYSGYLSNFRMVKGTAIYTAAFTPPTLPVTAVSGTSLLTNFTNAGIYDAAWQNNALTVGDAQVSTTQAQWPTTSMKFDGTGDYLTAPSNSAFAFGTGDFTIECWVYLNASKDQAIIDTRNTGPSTSGIAIAINSSNFPYVYVNGTTLFTSSTALSNTTWTYLAIVKSSNVITLYINGVKPSTGSGTSTTNLTDTSLTIAGIIDARDTTTTYKLNGYIQDLRITKGVARTITTPTAAFPTR